MTGLLFFDIGFFLPSRFVPLVYFPFLCLLPPIEEAAVSIGSPVLGKIRAGYHCRGFWVFLKEIFAGDRTFMRSIRLIQ